MAAQESGSEWVTNGMMLGMSMMGMRMTVRRRMAMLLYMRLMIIM